MERNQILEKMKLLKLWGMYRNFQSNLNQTETDGYTPDELLNMLLEAECCLLYTSPSPRDRS